MTKNKDNADSTPFLSTNNRQILLEQVFDDDSPGTILHDFETILDFIGSDGVSVSGKYKFLPLKFQDGNYIFKVSLGSTWRRVVIPAKMDFDTFSSSILDVFDFDDDHLYMFSF